MNQVQCFLYAQISRVLESKEKKRTIVFSNEVTGSTFLNRSVYINRFDGSFQPSDIQTENYSSCSFCDVEQADFWDFLYSDLWNDKFILRVLSGELYTALDVSLHELLQADEISRFVTFAYLKVKSEEEKEELKFDLSPEIVQVEFTYYNRNKSEKHSFSETVSHLVTEIQSLSNLTLDSELLSDVSLTKPSEDNTDMETEPKSKINQVSSAGNLSPIEINVININLGHFPCPNSLDIENDAESDCDSLENEIQKGKWITKDESLEKERPWHFGSKHQMMVRSMLQNSKWDTKGRTSRKLLTKTSKQNLEVTEVDVKEKLLMPAITMDINLSVLGRIMERERFLKFKKMSPKDRKKFFLSDERLEKVNQKLKTETLGETDLEHSQPTSRKTSRKHEKIMDIKNMEKFATLALGIVESPAIYRALIWLGNVKTEENRKI